MVTIFADTTSSIPVEEAKSLGIEYFPQIINFGDESYRDDYELDPATFLQKLMSSSILPKTAAPPPSLYNPIFEKHIKSGNSIIVLTPSSKISGTFRSAEVAAQDYPDADIKIFDTFAVGASLASIVIKANQYAKDGLSSDDILTKVEDLKLRERNLFVVDTLEYLYKGGRIGGAKMLFGSILQVKPLLTLKNGQVEPVESQRTSKKAIARLKDIVLSDCKKNGFSMFSIQHGAAEKEANLLAEDFKKLLDIDQIEIFELPPAFLTHSGPGVLGVSYFVNKN
ncbi:MAG: DegV family protein [Anaerolineaceae bacterium]|nr:DegV family protein [Anaerolineaceae bacterium]